MKKILFVTPSNLEVSPYVEKYLELFNKVACDIDIITWNRYETKNVFHKEKYSQIKEIFEFQKDSSIVSNKIKKFFDFIKYSKFVQKIISGNNYDKIVFFTTSSILFIKKAILKNNRYIFDYRDTSLEFIPMFKRYVTRAIKYSDETFISSEGFLKILPKKYLHKYNIIHNINTEQFCETNFKTFLPQFPKANISILYAGLFTQRKIMVKFLKYCKNHSNLTFNLWGYSFNPKDDDFYAKYIKKHKLSNVFLKGAFSSQDKEKIYLNSDMMIYYYHHSYRCKFAVSNRYYDALLFGKPCIVNPKTTIGDFIIKNGLGISLNLGFSKAAAFYNSIEPELFNSTRKILIDKIIEENKNADNKIVYFIEN